MRVAILSHHKSLGGGSRFVQGLLGGMVGLTDVRVTELALFLRKGAPEAEAFIAIAQENPRLALHLINDDGSLVNERGKPRRTRPSFREWLRRNRVLVAVYRMIKFGILRRAKDIPVIEDDQPPSMQFNLGEDVLRELDRFDVVYVTWPRLLKPLKIRRPIVATFHDFNQRHGFAVFSPEERRFIDAEVSEWLSSGVYPITSTPFIADELERFYPESRHSPSVVYLSTFVLQQPDERFVIKTRRAYELTEDYIICPTNVGPHKNLPRLIRAYSALRRKGHTLPLVLTGGGTQMVGRDPSEEWLYHTPLKDSIDAINDAVAQEGLELGSHLFTLGYIPDADVDALIAGATMVVAPSLYEAGTGPGLDAWSVGTPLAVSRIVPVQEQMMYLGTKALLFDPENENEITSALDFLASETEESMRMVETSRAAIDCYTWKSVAKSYIDVFEHAIRVSIK